LPETDDKSREANQEFGLNARTLAQPALEVRYYVKALAMAIPALMLGFQLSGWIFFLPGAMQGHCDFRHLYAAGYMVRTGHRGEVYDYGVEKKFQDSLVSQEAIALPFNHLAYEALLFAPYSYVSYRCGYFLFLATNVLLLAFALRLMGPWTRHLRSIFVWLPAALFFTFLPVAAAFMQGQDSVILLLLSSGAFALLSSDRTASAGFLMGLGLFKFQIVVPLALLFLLWRRWRFVGGFALSAATVLVVSVCLVGMAQMNVYAHSLLSMSVRETSVDQARFNVNPMTMPNLRGLISASVGKLVPLVWTQVLIGFASIGALIWIAKRGMRRNLSDQFTLAVSAATLLSYHLLIHDLSILLIPLSVMLDGYAASDQRDPAVGAAPALMFFAPAVIAFANVRPFVIGLPLGLFLAFQCLSTRRSLGRVPKV
jgi:hypothetical protein